MIKKTKKNSHPLLGVYRLLKPKGEDLKMVPSKWLLFLT